MHNQILLIQTKQNIYQTNLPIQIIICKTNYLNKKNIQLKHFQLLIQTRFNNILNIIHIQ